MTTVVYLNIPFGHGTNDGDSLSARNQDFSEDLGVIDLAASIADDYVFVDNSRNYSRAAIVDGHGGARCTKQTESRYRNIRDAKNYAHHEHINNYYLKKIERKKV